MLCRSIILLVIIERILIKPCWDKVNVDFKSYLMDFLRYFKNRLLE